VKNPIVPDIVKDETIVAISAGLFHSAAMTAQGELITFGCSRFGQGTEKWRPDDGSRLVQVACGRRHTVLLDEHGRIWTLGESKYGQLGRLSIHSSDGIPQLVDGRFGSACVAIDCGWSHNVATFQTLDGRIEMYGWGRNDRGQLGTGTTENVEIPIRLFEHLNDLESVSCGSEYTIILHKSGKISSCGWNEHGNLSLGHDRDALVATPIVGARVVAPSPLSNGGVGKAILAAGGAHFITMKI
jgi:alpha-tubulin suppressor-like RCC1 family protein